MVIIKMANKNNTDQLGIKYDTSLNGKLLSRFRFPFWKLSEYAETKWNRFVRFFSWPYYGIWVHPLIAIAMVLFLFGSAFFFICAGIEYLEHWH